MRRTILRKKTVLFMIPVICLFLASGLKAEEQPVTVQELFENLPYSLVFHDSMGYEYHLTWAGYYGICDTYTGYIQYKSTIEYPECYMWITQAYFQFAINAISNYSYGGWAITGNNWTDNTITNLTQGYVYVGIDFYKGEVPSGFQITVNLDSSRQ
jgi:hypothetical protein